MLATSGVTAGMLVSAAAAGAAAILSARALGPSGRGALAVAVALSSYAALLGNNGMTIAARRLLADPNDPLSTFDYFASALRRSAAVLALQCIAAIVLMPLAGVGQPAGPTVIMVSYGMMLFACQVTRDGLYGLGQNVLSSGFNAAGNIVVLVLVVPLSVSGTQRISWFLLSLAVGSSAEFLLGAWRMSAGAVVGPSSVTNRRRLRSDGRRGAPYTLSQALLLRADRYLLSAMKGPTSAGLYASAATVTEAVALVPLAASQTLFRPLAEGSLSRSGFERSRRLALGGTTLLAGAIAIAAPSLISLLFGPEFDGAVPALRVMLVGVVLFASYQIDCLALVAKGRFREASVAAMAGLVLMILLDVVLIPSIGLEGAAVATVVAYGVTAITARQYSRRLPFKLDQARIV